MIMISHDLPPEDCGRLTDNKCKEVQRKASKGWNEDNCAYFVSRSNLFRIVYSYQLTDYNSQPNKPLLGLKLTNDQDNQPPENQLQQPNESGFHSHSHNNLRFLILQRQTLRKLCILFLLNCDELALFTWKKNRLKCLWISFQIDVKYARAWKKYTVCTDIKTSMFTCWNTEIEQQSVSKWHKRF